MAWLVAEQSRRLAGPVIDEQVLNGTCLFAATNQGSMTMLMQAGGPAAYESVTLPTELFRRWREHQGKNLLPGDNRIQRV
jgi:hypothetical protein